MNNLALLAALTLAALAGTARADTYHAYPTTEQRAYRALYEHRSTPAPQPQARGNFGAFSTANTAHTLGY